MSDTDPFSAVVVAVGRFVYLKSPNEAAAEAVNDGVTANSSPASIP